MSESGAHPVETDDAIDGEEGDHPQHIFHGDEEASQEDDGGDEEDSGNDGGQPEAAAIGEQRRRRANAAEWSDKEITFDLPDFTIIPGPHLPTGQNFPDPLSVFDLFWRDLRSLIVVHTNRYAHRLLAEPVAPNYLRPWMEVTGSEIDVFMAILLIMGIKELPHDTMYWQQDKWGEPAVNKNMSRTRFLQLKRCLSVASPTVEENSKDKLAKCRSAVNLFLQKSIELYTPGQNLSLDESQILCCGRNARCAYRSDKHNIKPLKDYVKSYGLHESGTGYCIQFAIDERDKTTTRQYVHRLVDPLLGLQQPYRNVTDRYYTTVDTARSLQAKGLFMFGTLRRDRGCPKALLDDVQARPLKDGEFRWRMAPSNPTPLSVFVWRDSDKKGTPFLSTCHKPTVTKEVRRHVRGAADVLKQAPECAADYNIHMGYCDSANHMKRNYSVQLTHHRRWYMCVVYYVMELSLINSYIIWRKVADQPTLSHLSFRSSIVDSLLGRSSANMGASGPSPPKRQRIDPAKLPERRLSQEQHLVVSGPGRNCKWCYAVRKVQSSASFQCDVCGVPLHPKECFKLYHTAAQNP